MSWRYPRPDGVQNGLYEWRFHADSGSSMPLLR
jgi:hypothetical protein